MQIILLDEARFDEFASIHPNCSYYQSSFYGRLMSKHGYNSYYLGLVNEMNEIKAATLIIVKNEAENKRKMGYAPRGFLINWEDDYLVKEFTNALKSYLSKRNFTYLKLDPQIVFKNHNESIDSTENTNTQFVKNLQSLGYIHMGYNTGLETAKPRFNTICNLNPNSIDLYNSISQNARKKISDSSKAGNRVYKGSINDINVMYNIINKVSPPVDYYLDFYEAFNQNNFEIYFTRLEPSIFVDSSKSLYEKEEQKNRELNIQLQDFNIADKNNIINLKLKSDELLSKYKKNMHNAILMFQKYPNSIMVATVAIIKFGKHITFFTSGVNEQFKNTYPEYLLIWQLMDEYSKQGYKTFDFNGITNLNDNSEQAILKKELSNNIVEYVGEFDLVINKRAYYTESKINPIITWLNTPI